MRCISFILTSVLTGMLAAPVSLEEKPLPPKEPLKIQSSWYGPGFHGKLMANGKFNQNLLTVAHRAWSFGTRLLLRNPSNGKTVVVTVTDRGPYINKRGLDVSQACARKLGFEKKGVELLEVTFLD